MGDDTTMDVKKAEQLSASIAGYIKAGDSLRAAVKNRRGYAIELTTEDYENVLLALQIAIVDAECGGDCRELCSGE